jgi:anti-sigma factor RsiW
MDPMDCDKILPLLDLHAGGDLDRQEQASVEAHLRSCLACWREFTAMRGLLEEVRGSARAEFHGESMSESIVAGVMGRIDGPPPALPRLLPRLMTASGWAAAAVLAVTLGWSVLREQPPAATRGAPTIVEMNGNGGGAIPIHTIGSELDAQLDELHRGSVRPRVVPAKGGARPRGM